jgi:mannose-6-phosphate isomerase-like protein (cupin superfamily)
MCSGSTEGSTMTREQPAHIEPTRHSTKDVDEFLRQVEGRVDVSRGTDSPVIKPNTDTPNNSGTRSSRSGSA